MSLPVSTLDALAALAADLSTSAIVDLAHALDRSLDALPTLGTSLVDLPSQAGGLVRVPQRERDGRVESRKKGGGGGRLPVVKTGGPP